MKKILLIAAFFISTGVLTSCKKDNTVAPTSISKTLADDDSGAKNTLGNGDGSRPSHN
jgi:hypothetical protein